MQSVPLQQHINNKQVAVVDLLASAAETAFSLDSVYDRVEEAAASLRTDGCGLRIVIDDLSVNPSAHPFPLLMLQNLMRFRKMQG